MFQDTIHQDKWKRRPQLANYFQKNWEGRRLTSPFLSAFVERSHKCYRAGSCRKQCLEEKFASSPEKVQRNLVLKGTWKK